MHKSGIEDHYLIRDGKKLRFGYTTGSCAAAAAKGAVLMLAKGIFPDSVEIFTPKGIRLDLELLDRQKGDNWASCAVKKFSGDDPDVTDGVLVYAKACWSPKAGINVDGGEGVGRITKPGLKQKIGEAAINPVPMSMIKQAAEEALDDCGQAPGLELVISIPMGAELAKKTFNPRLGVEGGISVLGTSGIVEPMSEAALTDSIDLEIKQKKALGGERLIAAPGNYGADFLRSLCALEEKDVLKCANFIGRTIDMAAGAGYGQMLLVGHIGKMIKLAGGIMNTHSREGDCRGELMAACALRAGACAETARSIMDSLTTAEMIRILEEEGLLKGAMEQLAVKLDFHLRSRARDMMEIGAVVFSEQHGILCTTGPADLWLQEIRERGGGKMPAEAMFERGE